MQTQAPHPDEALLQLSADLAALDVSRHPEAEIDRVLDLIFDLEGFLTVIPANTVLGLRTKLQRLKISAEQGEGPWDAALVDSLLADVGRMV